MSSAKRVSPTHFERASTLRKGRPTTFKSLPSAACAPLTFAPVPFCPSLLVAIDTLSRENRVSLAAHFRGGKLDGLVDFDVAGAAAEVPRQGFFNLVARRTRVL